jgi:hypothetical protein
MSPPQVTLTATPVTLVNPNQQKTAVIIIKALSTNTTAARYTLDGTNPTATSGDRLEPGERVILNRGGASLGFPIIAMAESGSPVVTVATNA